MSPSAERLQHLPPGASRLGALFARPQWIAAGCIVVLAALGWAYLALMIAQMGGPAAALGPGMSALDLVPRVIDVLCLPTFGMAMPHEAWDATGFAMVGLMWGAMTLAMMLPSAAPMILTYAEIADTAARKGERIVSPFLLAGGYTAVWLAFAVAATLAQYALTRVALIDPAMASVNGLFSGAIFLVAGVYQFSALKHACLTQCRNPFPFFFTNWATTPAGVFRLGLRQGLFCFGCCWAMMLVMFAVGVMNVVWMAGLGIVMTVEKMVTGNRLTQALGVVLIAAGLGFIAMSVMEHWPVRTI